MDEKLLERLTAIENTVKENGGLKELDRDKLVEDFRNLLIERDQKALENTPVRPGEDKQTEPVQKAVEAYQGKYKREIKDIARDGQHKIGNWALRESDLVMAKMLLDKSYEFQQSKQSFSNAISPKDGIKPASEDLTAACKALATGSTGAGAEYVPNLEATELWNDFFSASKVVADMQQTPMPSDPFDLPVGMQLFTWRKGAQLSSQTAYDPGTLKSTLTSTEQVVEIDWSYNLDEDSIIAIMPTLRMMAALSGGEQMDAFALNADPTATATNNINLVDAQPPADAYYLTNGQAGIRKQWLVDNTGQGKTCSAGALTDALMAGGLKALGKYGLDYQNARIVPDIVTYLSGMLGLTNVATMEKYGPQATIVAGELARYRGIPILPSYSHVLCNTAGKVSNTGGNNIYGSISMYHRNMWKVGFRRGLTIEVDRMIQSRKLIMVISFRIAVASLGTRSTATHTAGLYDILV